MILVIEILFGLGLLSLGFVSPALLVIGAIYFIFLFLAGVKIVRPQTVRTKEVFGKYTGILRQGLNLVVPFVTITREQDLYRKNFFVEVEGISKDNVVVYVNLSIIYYVRDDGDDSKQGNIYKSVYSIDDPRTMMRAAIDEQLVDIIKKSISKDIFFKKIDISLKLKEILSNKLRQFGYTIDYIKINDIKIDNNIAKINEIKENQKINIQEIFKDLF